MNGISSGVGLPIVSVNSPIMWGVLLGLVVGKPAGILLASLLALKTRLAALPTGATLRHVVGVAVLCGIGFTMSLFVANLAFPTDGQAADCLTEGEDGKGMASGIVAEILANPEGFYVNVHNNEFPNGAVRAQLAESHDH